MSSCNNKPNEAQSTPQVTSCAVYEYSAEDKKSKSTRFSRTILSVITLVVILICVYTGNNLAVTNTDTEPDPPKYTVQFVKPENGEITGSGSYEEGKEIIVRATPYEGYVFKGWYEKTGVDENGEPQYKRISGHKNHRIKVEKDVVLRAKFRKASTTDTSQPAE
ncbi:MAG: InlB B-repeat-containing protein [Eubacterium sp.]